MYLIRHLNHNALKAKLDAAGVLRERPDLAAFVLTGQSPYLERKGDAEPSEAFALEGSFAASPAEKAEISDAEAEARLDRILARSAGRAEPTQQTTPALPPTPDDPSLDLVRLALSDIDREPLDHLFPEPPSAA